MNELYLGDCLEIMKNIKSGSVDMILCDLPYGTINGMRIDGYKRRGNSTDWDVRLNTIDLFTEYERILRENGIAILFSQEPYTSELRTANVNNFNFLYPLIWKKDHFANALISKKAPVSYFEDMSVFVKPYDRQLNNPLRGYAKQILNYINLSKSETVKIIGQQADHFFRINSTQFSLCSKGTYDKLIDRFNISKMTNFISYEECKEINKKYGRVFNVPHSSKFIGNVFEFKKDYQGLHPTQKPVKLLESLIRIYTNKGDVVLDNCMGSGSTGVACVNTGRNFIGIELDRDYFDIAKERIDKAVEMIE